MTRATTVTISEIADLLARCRHPTQTGPSSADPVEQAAYQQAEACLLARRTDTGGQQP